MKKTYGIIGYPLSHSFSNKYFTEKFERENLSDSLHKVFSLSNISELTALIEQEE